ncbi:hypothetical protein HY639_01570 [Candidatus Woesearchaeota archaeon]|nr:hypothetical protein [Candidatus Woesearchaeota archaeon]
MQVTLCSSASFFDQLYGIQHALEARGYSILLPSMQNYHSLHEDVRAKIQYHLIREHFRNIEKSDAIYVANYDKNGIIGYIGGNVFLEMGKAFDQEIPIFLMNTVPEMSYKEEILAMHPIVIGTDWGTLDERVKDEIMGKRK